MKKGVVAALVVLLVVSNVHFTRGAEQVKILVDESRVYGWDEETQRALIQEGWPEDTDWDWSFENGTELWGFGVVRERLEKIGSVDIRKSGTLSYSTLKDYDVLVIATSSKSYSSSEAAEIKKFVENGGSLLLLADYDQASNSVSRSFDVLFCSETAIVAEKEGFSKTFVMGNFGWSLPKPIVFYASDITNHPVTEGITKVTMVYALPITSHTSGTVLVRSSADSWLDTNDGVKQPDEEEGPFDLVLASEVGKGRAVFIGSIMSFINCVAKSEKQNVELMGNAVEWLGEPGGPYKQYQALNAQAQQAFADAVALFDSHTFSEAKTAFERVIAKFEESNSIYRNSDATKGIADAKAYIAKCETGMKADETFKNATSLFESKDYGKAMEEFNKAQLLYDEIEYTEKATECAAHAVFASGSNLFDMREYEKAIEEFNKAKLLYEEIRYTEKADECTAKVDESNKWIALRDKAKQQFQAAEDTFSKAPSMFSPGGYKKAKSLYEESRKTWQEYNDPTQVAACEEKISQCDTEIARINKNLMLVTVVVAVIVVVVVAVVFIRKRKRIEAPSPPVPPPTSGEPVPPAAPGTSVLSSLDERYVKGKITKEEYEKLKSVLLKE